MNNVSIKGYHWINRDASIDKVTQLIQQHNVSEILARLLVGRGIDLDQVSNFLAPTLKNNLPDPFHLIDMRKAAEIIADAVMSNEKIVIFGDYDVDGATSSALLKRYLTLLNVNADVYIPDRIDEGYGPSVEAFAYLKEQGADLIITVDCGTVAFDAINFAKANNLKIIVVDHHLSGHEIPQADALVNPNRSDESSQYGYLAAVGVAFLVAVAVNSILRHKGYFNARSEPYLLGLLDIVAIGTVCDVVPLEGLNRAFVVQGLKVLNKRKNPGVLAFCNLLNITGELTVYHLGYVIGPRINAGGRVGESSLGARLLATDSLAEAIELAQKLEIFNAERKAIEFGVFEQALAQAKEQSEEDKLILVAGNNWHPGVVGIVAGRLKEMMNKPTAVLSLNVNEGKASCRSVPGVDFGSAIVMAKEKGLLLSGGGHKMAAGFTVELTKIVALKSFLNENFATALSMISDKDSRYFDAYISVGSINLNLVKEIELLGPFGANNPEPKFLIKNVYIAKNYPFGESHINCMIGCNESKNLTNLVKATAFRSIDTNLGKILLEKNNNLDLIGYLRINRWKDKEVVEFIIEDAICL